MSTPKADEKEAAFVQLWVCRVKHHRAERLTGPTSTRPCIGPINNVAMQQFDNNQSEYPAPETVLAIRGAIATGRHGGPMGPEGHWLNEFWQIGRTLRDHREILQGFQGTVCRSLLSTSTRYLAINEPLFERPDEQS